MYSFTLNLLWRKETLALEQWRLETGEIYRSTSFVFGQCTAHNIVFTNSFIHSFISISCHFCELKLLFHVLLFSLQRSNNKISSFTFVQTLFFLLAILPVSCHLFQSSLQLRWMKRTVKRLLFRPCFRPEDLMQPWLIWCSRRILPGKKLEIRFNYYSWCCNCCFHSPRSVEGYILVCATENNNISHFDRDNWHISRKSQCTALIRDH